MDIQFYKHSSTMLPMISNLINPSTILLCYIIIAHLYTRFSVKGENISPVAGNVSGDVKAENAIPLETALLEPLPQVLPQVLPQELSHLFSQTPVFRENALINTTLVTDLEVTIIDALFTLKLTSARELRKTLVSAIPGLTLSQVNSILYSLLKRKVTVMTKSGITPFWSLAN